MNAPYELTAADRSLLYPILRTQAHSRNQHAMAAHVYAELQQLGATVEYDQASGNIYATKGSATLYPCFVAHLDTVHAHIPNYDIRQYPSGDLVGWNLDTNKVSGIGGDDKCGIFIALAMLRDLPAAKVALFTDEEIGCIGASMVNLSFFDDCSFVLEADRKGNGDIVRDASGTELYGADFGQAISETLTVHNYAPTYGMMTDVMTLKESGLAIACLNMSAGYHRPHQPDTYINPADLARALSLARGITEAASGTQWHHTYEYKRRQWVTSVVTDYASWSKSKTSRKKANDYTGMYTYGTCSDCHQPLENDGWCSDCSAFRPKFWYNPESPAIQAEPRYGECPFCYDTPEGNDDPATYDAHVGIWYCYLCDSWAHWDNTGYEIMADPYAIDSDDETDAHWRVLIDNAVAAD